MIGLSISAIFRCWINQLVTHMVVRIVRFPIWIAWFDSIQCRRKTSQICDRIVGELELDMNHAESVLESEELCDPSDSKKQIDNSAPLFSVSSVFLHNTGNESTHLRAWPGCQKKPIKGLFYFLFYFFLKKIQRLFLIFSLTTIQAEQVYLIFSFTFTLTHLLKPVFLRMLMMRTLMIKLKRREMKKFKCLSASLLCYANRIY